MAEVVLRWVWRHHALCAEVHDSVEDAFEAAVIASDDGTEALETIEVVGNGGSSLRYSPAEVWEWERRIGFKWIDEGLTLPWGRVEVSPPWDAADWTVVQSVEFETGAAAALEWWAERLGADRVRIVEGCHG